MAYDVVIVGGGPGGLQGALSLGRARKRVLVCDAGPRRNAAAVHLQNFVTRDGIAPTEFRAIAREQLATYPNVEVRDEPVTAISGERGAFTVTLPSGSVTARRIVLATGMIDEPLPIPGYRELWGRSIFQCPYCHGWEIADRRWGVLVQPQHLAHVLPFALQARGWTSDMTVYTHGVELPADTLATLRAGGVKVESAAVTQLVAGADGGLAEVALADGRRVACDALFSHPPQRHVELVRSLGLALDDDGFVKIDPMKRETSVPGIYAAGDLTTRMQGAILAASLGVQTVAMLNVELTMEHALAGQL